MEKKELSLEEKVINIIAQRLGKKPETINLNSNLVEDVGADSLDVVELLMQLEDGYHIIIPNEEAVKLNTIGDIVKFLEKTVKTKQSLFSQNQFVFIILTQKRNTTKIVMFFFMVYKLFHLSKYGVYKPNIYHTYCVKIFTSCFSNAYLV